MYRQVNLQKLGFNTFKTCWIPDIFAYDSKIVEIEGELWQVIWASSNTIKGPLYPEALIREHRKNTGDAIPRKTNV